MHRLPSAVLFIAFSALVSATVPHAGPGYEVWASDQSNSAPNMTSLGVKGSWLWIFDSADIESQIGGGADAEPVSCTPNARRGPCNLLDVFPQRLVEYNQDKSPTGNTLRDIDGFGRQHGVIKDPQGLYVCTNFFAPNGGFVGIIDVSTKEAICLFRVTKLKFGDKSARSVHMSFWTADGSALILANLNGKAVERINVERDTSGAITDLHFDKSATLGLGSGMSVVEDASFFAGENAFGNLLIGSITGDYEKADLQDLTPNGKCKENGCSSDLTGMSGGRPNNLPICPIVSSNNFLYITLAGGGLLVADPSATPMSIVAEYGNGVVYGAGCGGVQSGDKVFLNSGVSASGPGATQSMFGLLAFKDSAYLSGVQPENEPLPDVVFRDEGNTLTGGNTIGTKASDTSGQLPGNSTRRDSHGGTTTINGQYVYAGDRIQNLMEVFDAKTYERSTMDLTSEDGNPGRYGAGDGACSAKSVSDDPSLPINDPAPDLMDRTPDGKYLMVALRGPTPVSVSHTGQGSCPGVGVIALLSGGKKGKLISVLRSTNTLPDAVTITKESFKGGISYRGYERSDIHGAEVVPKASPSRW